jgi:hypothetical protein
MCHFAPEEKTAMAVAEPIALWFHQTPLRSPVPPITRNAELLRTVREQERQRLPASRHEARKAQAARDQPPRARAVWWMIDQCEQPLGDGPELAAAVASRFHRNESVVRKVRRLIREAERFEYVRPGLDSTGNSYVSGLAQNPSANLASSLMRSGDHGGVNTISDSTFRTPSTSPTNSSICSVT